MAGLGARSSNHTDYEEDTTATGNEDEDYYIPPQTSRPFGAGIKRKRVTFVPASSHSSSTPTLDPNLNSIASNISARYLSIVLPTTNNPEQQLAADQGREPESKCPVCGQSRDSSSAAAHEASIAHQLALEHSHPPSSLDRDRKGLKYLVGHGWDPDSRVGLGVRGKEGIRVPVKAVPKRDTAGLGLFGAGAGDGDDADRQQSRKREKVAEGEKTMLNAKQVRQAEDEKKKRAEKLRNAFYGEDLSRYLGPDG